MPQPKNLVHETTTGTGTGNLTLTVANGKQSFDTAFSHGATTNVFDYFIMNQSAAEYEIGTGHMSDATTLVRDTVIESTNANAAVNFSAGTKDVTNDVPALRQKYDVHGADVASAATTNLDTATGDLIDVTGTTSITAITLSEGLERTVRFTGALTLTNGASLVLPGGANITTAAGDFAIFRGYASSVVRCVDYIKASGLSVIPGSVQSKIITFTRDASAASGNVSYTGVGFKPTAIRFTAVNGGSLWYEGWTDASSGYSYHSSNSATYVLATTYCVTVVPTGSSDPTTSGNTGTINSFDSDGFTIAWTKHGAPASAVQTVHALCFR